MCGVSPTATKRCYGKLERYHRTISAADLVGKSANYSWYAKGRSSQLTQDMEG